MKITNDTEYFEGLKSGLMHYKLTGVLRSDNERKVALGIADRPLIAAYWQGYRGGMIQAAKADKP